MGSLSLLTFSSDHRYLLAVASGNFHLPFSASARGL
jgi:hypothetical protein